MRDCSDTPIHAARVRAAWQTQVTAAVKTPGLLPDLIRRRTELLPRFATAYTQLRALPRRVRRALQRKWGVSLASLALCLVLGQSPVEAATINVSSTCTLINAIRAANTDTATGGCSKGSGADTIRLPANSIQTLTSINNSTHGPTGLPVITSKITIAGQKSTIKRGNSAPEFRILAVSNTGDLTLQETTVSGGVAPGSDGGGVANYGGTLTLTNSTLSGNVASGGVGGGVANFGGTLTLMNSTLSGNSASGGGGVANFGGTLTLTNSTLSGNVGGAGGGVFNGSDGALTILNSTLSFNGAYGGGGVFNYGTLTVQNSTLSGNSGHYGGGGVSNYGTLTVQNSTLSGNSTILGDGGGALNYGTLTVQNSTLSGNSADFGGGGVYNYGALTLAHTLVSGNTASSGSEIYNGNFSDADAVQVNNHNLFGLNGNAGVVGFRPRRFDIVPKKGVLLSHILHPTLARNGGPTLTHALVRGSPALNIILASDPSCTGADQRGVPRPQGGKCDIGAVEGLAPTLVNDLVTFVPLSSTFQTSSHVRVCPAGFVATFRFSARLTTQASSPPLVALVVEVDTFNGNLLQNAQEGPKGGGAHLPAPARGGFADGLLTPNESVDVPFVICLKQKGPFQFLVDVLGVEEE